MSENFEVLNYDNVFLCRYITTKIICNKQIKEHSLIYVQTGMLELEYDNKKYVFNAGESVFVKRSLEVHLTKLSKDNVPFSGVFFIMDDDFLKSQSGKYKIDNNKVFEPIIRINSNAILKTFFQTFMNYIDNGIVPSEEIIKVKKVEGLFNLLQIKPELASLLFDFNAGKKINLYDFMETNYKKNLTLEEFAHYSYRSLSSFKREFKELFKESPHKWILNKRLEQAKQLILNGEKASSIYMDLGFNSLQHFSKCFRNKYNNTIRQMV